MHLAGPDPTALLVQRNGRQELVGHIEDGPPAQRSGLLGRHLEQGTAHSPPAYVGTHQEASHHTQLVGVGTSAASAAMDITAGMVRRWRATWPMT